MKALRAVSTGAHRSRSRKRRFPTSRRTSGTKAVLHHNAGARTQILQPAAGGASSFFSKPSWQSGVSGIPTDGKRDMPDVSLTAALHDPYLVCFEFSGEQNFIYLVGGTKAIPLGLVEPAFTAGNLSHRFCLSGWIRWMNRQSNRRKALFQRFCGNGA